MATGVTGYFDLTGSYGITLRVNYTENYDAAANTSTLSLSLQFKSSQYYGIRYYLNGPLSVDGKAIVTFSSVAGTTSVVATALNTFATVSGGPWTSGAITHNTDGSKSVAVSIDVQGFTTSGGVTNGWRVTGSRTVALTTIPRASTIGATDANIGATSMIAVNKKASAYTHSIAYKFGALTGYITESGGISGSEVKLSAANIAFAVPTSFYAQIPNAKTGVCTLTVKTYSGNTQIGSAQTCTFTVTADKSVCAPTVSGTVVDSNEITKALTGDANKLIRYFSNALCTVTAAAKNSATVAKKTIAGVEVTGNTRTIAKVETASFVFGVVDSRGYSANVTVANPPSLIAYIPLTCNVTVTRDGPTTGKAILKASGNCFGGSFGAVSNALTVRYRIKKAGGSYGDYVSLTPTIGNGTWSASASLSDLDYLSEWGIEVTAADKLVSITKQAALSRGIPVFDWGQDSFAFHVPLSIQDRSLADFVVEQGSSGVWTYRKWNSGKAECWMSAQVNATVPGWESFGSLYYNRISSLRADFPSGLFVSTPLYFPSVRGSTYDIAAWIALIGGDTTATAPASYALFRPAVPSVASVFNICAYAFGRWK